MVAVVSIDDLKRLQQLEAERERDFEALWRTGEAFKDVSNEEIQREVDRALAEVGAESREAAQRPSTLGTDR